MGFEAYTWDSDGKPLHGWSNVSIVNSLFETMDWYNIDLADGFVYGTYNRLSGPVRIANNVLKGAGRYTICVESPKGCVIEGNTIWRSGSQTFKMGSGDQTHVDPACIVRNNLFDLAVDNGKGQGSPSFYLKGGGNQFTGNTVTATAPVVFELQQARGNVITGNTIRKGSATLFAIDDGCSGNVTSPNTIT
jgi:hypothetical protein